jgi:hypothetical protein
MEEIELRTFRPTNYGMTGADAEYIKEHGLVPDASGAYPRLDHLYKVEQIECVDGFIEVAALD